MVKNFFADTFIRFGDSGENSDKHRQTPHAGIYSAYAYASRSKNDQLKQILLEIITSENYATFTIFNKLLNSAAKAKIR